MKYLKFIIEIFSTKEIVKILSELLSCLKEFFQYKKQNDIIKKEEKEEKKEQNFEKKLEDVVNNGDIQDLINLKK